MSNRHDPGETFIELLIAILLAGMLALFGTLSLGNWRISPLQKEAHLLHETIENLVLLSQDSGDTLSLTIHSDRYEIGKVIPPLLPERLHPLPKSIQILLEKENPLTLAFYTSGVSTPATLTLTDQTRKCVVTLSLRGRCLLRC